LMAKVDPVVKAADPDVRIPRSIDGRFRSIPRSGFFSVLDSLSSVPEKSNGSSRIRICQS